MSMEACVMDSDAKLLDVEDLHVSLKTPEGVVRAVDGISLEVRSGETLCLVGESGCGKTVTSLAIMGLIPAHNSEVHANKMDFQGKGLLEMSSEGRRKLRGRSMSMVFQEPMTSLNPVHTIGHQLSEVYKTHTDLAAGEIRERCIEVMQKVGIPSPEERMNVFPHQLSGGLRQRAMIAMALAVEPRLLIADEPTTALDVTIQAQILGLLRRMKQELDMSIILITHDFGVVSEMADRVAVMYAGKIVEESPLAQTLEKPLHPYTRALLASIPGYRSKRGRRLEVIRGMVPNPLRFPSGCRFHPRCEWAMDKCRTEEPVPVTSGDRKAACWRLEDLP